MWTKERSLIMSSIFWRLQSSVFITCGSGHLRSMREKAPGAATPDRFANVPNFFSAWQSGLSVGVPGVPKLMKEVHSKYGTLDWKDGGLFDDAKELAANGFPISPAMNEMVAFLLNYNVVSGFNCTHRFL